MNRRTRGLRPAPSFKADQYNQWCDQPFDVPLSVRRKITYSLTFLSQRSAYRFAVDLLKAEQQVCFQSGEPPETASKVVASPVMNPMPSNLHGYGAVLKTHVVRIGCAHAQLGRADVSNVESTFEGVTVGFEFPNFARAYRGAVVMLK